MIDAIKRLELHRAILGRLEGILAGVSNPDTESQLATLCLFLIAERLESCSTISTFKVDAMTDNA